MAEVQQKADAAESAQMNTLADTNKEFEEAAKADQQAEKTDDKDKKEDKNDSVSNKKEDKNDFDTDENIEVIADVKGDIKIEKNSTDLAEVVGISGSETTAYKHVDVRL